AYFIDKSKESGNTSDGLDSDMHLQEYERPGSGDKKHSFFSDVDEKASHFALKVYETAHSAAGKASDIKAKAAETAKSAVSTTSDLASKATEAVQSAAHIGSEAAHSITDSAKQSAEYVSSKLPGKKSEEIIKESGPFEPAFLNSTVPDKATEEQHKGSE